MEKRTLPPVVTYALCALSVIVTLASQTSNPASTSPWAMLGHYADNGSYDVWNGRIGLLITGIFIHADFRAGMGVMHLLFNLLWLYQLGRRLEKSIGPLWFTGFVVVAAFLSSGCELAWSGAVGVGMSGIVYAMFAFMWVGRDTSTTSDLSDMSTPSNASDRQPPQAPRPFRSERGGEAGVREKFDGGR